MKNSAICIAISMMLCVVISCKTKNSKAFAVFNEGVSFSLDAADAQGKGDFEKATLLDREAIEKFKETLKIDSNHKIAPSALAHSLYLDKQFDEAIKWYEKTNKIDSANAVNFLELGLSRINIGQVKQGRETIEKAFELDKSKETRAIAVDQLADIGTRAFSFGRDYTAKGDKENGENYQHFAITVLIMAYDFDTNRKDISFKISQYADEVKDKAIADQYRNK
jgi:tetratricopeptide (TPR) repeat protein